MRKLETTVGFALIILTLSISAQASEYYTWVDENGVVNFSERDPTEYDAELVSSDRQRAFGYPARRRAEPETPAAEAPPTNEAAEQTVEEAEAAIAAERAQLEAENAQILANNCAIGKRNLAQLELYARVRVPDGQGGEKVLTDEEKATRIAEAKKVISENCTS